MVQAVATPILPDSAMQRLPSQRMPDWSLATSFNGMRARSSSLSVEKRGQEGA